MSITWNMETDVVVLGGGGCGIVAALAARQKGVEVVLLEKDRRLGGNTSLSTGSVPGAGTRFQQEAGIEDSPERMAQDIYNKGNRQGDYELLLYLCQQSKWLVEWLVDDMQINIELIKEYKHVGHSQFRLHAPRSRRGTDLVNDLVKALKRNEVVVATNIAGTDLVTDENGVVIGVKTEVNNTVEYIKCKKVILGTNGFGANKQMVEQFCPDISKATYFGAMGSTGEGILWGQRLGGQVRAMGAYQGYAAVSTHGTLVSWTTVEKGGVLVNKDGKRFVDESMGYSACAGPVLRQEEGIVYVILDERIKKIAESEDEFRELVNIGAVKGGVNTIEELAGLIQIDEAALSETVKDYQEAIKTGNDSFGRKECGIAPLQAPYYAVKASAGLFHTQGGLVINKYAQPIKADGTPIENLYVGGGVAVGVSGEQGAGGYSSGNGLFTALGWGKIAGEHAASAITEGR
ncbi:MAG: fumarate reductase/succinate dehydrogenase flavoprotein domain protein [Bacilli bacterium]|nr:fumarate reductase/succinate dehydrogenase flavoprotein domain protein [Bacilli bacterium]